jgi:hypothetical protein
MVRVIQVLGSVSEGAQYPTAIDLDQLAVAVVLLRFVLMAR